MISNPSLASRPSASGLSPVLSARSRTRGGSVHRGVSEASIHSAISQGLSSPKRYNEITSRLNEFVSQCAHNGTPIEISVHLVDSEPPNSFVLDDYDEDHAVLADSEDDGVEEVLFGSYSLMRSHTVNLQH